MLSAPTKNSQNYHHGNLKEELILAASALIEKEGAENISLRKLAKEVGVTPSAAYNHFSDKDALLQSVKGRLFQDFNDYFAEATAAISDPEQALLEMCHCYYRYSQQYPTQFEFLFNTRVPVDSSTPEDLEKSVRCLVQARELIEKIYHKYGVKFSEKSLVDSALLIWSQIHGIIGLKNSGSIYAAITSQGWPRACSLENDSDVEQLINNHVEALAAVIRSGKVAAPGTNLKDADNKLVTDGELASEEFTDQVPSPVWLIDS